MRSKNKAESEGGGKRTGTRMGRKWRAKITLTPTLNCYKTVAGGIYDKKYHSEEGKRQAFWQSWLGLEFFLHIKDSFLPFWEISPRVFRVDRGGGSALSTQLFGSNLHSFKLLEQVRICSGISVQHSQASAAWICIHTLCIVHTFWVSFVSSLETLQQ